ncbi:ornithine cyclodeaminase family protein [Trebonia kvetii]|uniref:Ornithine cyclodeaminase family protein n=1 Tax=Trebonia kvetii TaxID=2480626 RepID=A0A6P2C3Q7_9ACTN|nr:ornithine cyclodeaminase family protein [Trebonia kvetii]TVZ05125.1 ornithine cyclodeaminase family protein [Trebonia kvetii]
MTLLLSGSDLSQLLDVTSCLNAIRDGFTAVSSGIEAQRVSTALPGPGSATALIPGLVEGIPAYTVKVNAKFPASRPALRGVVCLHDIASGELLALLDSATVTAWRTGLAAAIGTDAMAGSAAGTVAVIGAGTQAGLVLRGLKALRLVDRLVVCDVDPARGSSFAAVHAGGRTAVIAADAREAARDADIVIVATWSRVPLLDDGDMGPGAHVTALGADEPGKTELSAALLRSARVIVDDTRLAVTSGALGTAGLSAGDAAGTLADVLRGTVPGRTSDSEITIYAPVGLPWQDLALAWTAYQQALRAGIGRHFDFLA